jgi:hypothetical protein
MFGMFENLHFPQWNACIHLLCTWFSGDFTTGAKDPWAQLPGDPCTVPCALGCLWLVPCPVSHGFTRVLHRYPQDPRHASPWFYKSSWCVYCPSMKLVDDPESIRASCGAVIPSLSRVRRRDMFENSAAQYRGSLDIEVFGGVPSHRAGLP